MAGKKVGEKEVISDYGKQQRTYAKLGVFPIFAEKVPCIVFLNAQLTGKPLANAFRRMAAGLNKQAKGIDEEAERKLAEEGTSEVDEAADF